MTTDSRTEPVGAARRAERVRHPLKLRTLQVERVTPLGPGFVSVDFGGEALSDFVSLSFDDHVKLMFPGSGPEPERRDFTPRRADPARRSLTIEFALHEQGPASDWARQAAPGQQLLIGGPRGSMVFPTALDWHLLAGDATALPAIHRRLEELPAGARAFAIVQVDDPADRREIRCAADLQLTWVHDRHTWLQTLDALTLPPGDGLAWLAGEAATMAEARERLRQRHGLPGDAIRASAYWKRGAGAFHETLDDAPAR